MRRSEPQPRSRNTPSGGSRMAKLESGVWSSIQRSGVGGNIQNLEEKSAWERYDRERERQTLQMSDAVKAMVKER